jgi:hypothetical protein
MSIAYAWRSCASRRVAVIPRARQRSIASSTGVQRSAAVNATSGGMATCSHLSAAASACRVGRSLRATTDREALRMGEQVLEKEVTYAPA